MFSIINWKLAARVVVSLGLLGWFVFSIEWHEIGRAVSGMNYFWLLAAVLWVILAVVVSVIKWRIILLAQGIKLAWRELWRIYWAGLFFNNFLPSSIGGDALRILWVGKSAGDAAGAAASVVTERILATTGLALVGIMAALCVSSGRSGILMLFVALLLVTVILLAVLMSGWLPALLKNRENRITCFLYNLSCHGRRIRKKPGAIVSALFWSVVFQICVVAVNFCVFNGLKLFQINWMDSMYVIPAVSVAAMLPLGINGYGLREGAYISLLSPYGVSAADAFASSIIFAFVISLCSLWGGWVWICRRRKGGEDDVKFASIQNS